MWDSLTAEGIITTVLGLLKRNGWLILDIRFIYFTLLLVGSCVFVHVCRGKRIPGVVSQEPFALLFYVIII